MILALTALCEHNINLAPYFVEIVVARLINPATNSTYKRPIFYLIDSIMKHVCGPFPAMFSKQFAEIYSAALAGIHDADRKKLEFLLATWNERNFFTAELVDKMKVQLLMSEVCPPLPPPPALSVCFALLHPSRPLTPFTEASSNPQSDV